MKAHVKEMTEGKPTPLILSFAFSLMAGNIFQQLYTVVDTMVVGKGLGVQALAALGAADWLNWMLLGIIQGLTQGFGIMMAQEFGAKHEDILYISVLCLAGFRSSCYIIFWRVFCVRWGMGRRR